MKTLFELNNKWEQKKRKKFPVILKNQFKAIKNATNKIIDL